MSSGAQAGMESEEKKRLLKLLFCLIFPLICFAIPDSTGITSTIKLFLYITFAAILMFAVDVTSNFIVSIFLIFAYAASGLVPLSTILSSWKSDIPWITLAALLIVTIVQRTTLLQRMTYHTVIRVGGSYMGIIFAVTIISVLARIFLTGTMASVSVMMVNNLRDLEDDAAHGKRTLMVRIGSGKGKCWCMRALGWAAGLTVVFAMPLSVYAGLLDLLIVLPAEVDRERSCTEYGICDDWSWGNADWMSLAAFVFIAGCVAIATRAVAAVRHDQWRRALPLCSVTSLVAAGAFVLNACQVGFMV